MKVNKVECAKFSNAPNNKSEKCKTNKADIKDIQESADTILATYGKAAINISFRGKIYASSSGEIKTLTDRRFKIYKAELDEKIKNLPLEVQEGVKNWNINKYNIQLADIILSDEALYKNESIMQNSERIIKDEKTIREPKAKAEIIRVLKDNNLFENRGIKSRAGEIIADTHNEKSLNVRKEIVNLLKTNGLLENEGVQKNVAKILIYTDTAKNLEAKRSVINALAGEELLHGKNVQENIGEIILKINNKDNAETKLKIINAIKESGLIKNESVQSSLGNILNQPDYEESVNAKLDIIDTIKNSKLLQYNEFKGYIGSIISITNSREKAKAKADVMDSACKNLPNSKDILKQAGNIVFYANTSGQADVLNEILSDKRFYINNDLISKLAEIIGFKNTKKDTDITLELVKMLQETDLINNKSVQKSVDFMIETTQSQKALSAKRNVINLIKDSEIINNEEVEDFIGDIIKNTHIQEQAEITSDLLSNKRLSDNQNVIMYLPSVIRTTTSASVLQARRELLDALDKKELFYNKDVLDNLGWILCGVINTSGAKTKILVIDKIFQNPAIYKNKGIIKDIGKIISKTDRFEANSFIREFNDTNNEIPINQRIALLLDEGKNLSLEDLNKLNKVMGAKRTSTLSKNETLTAFKYIDVFNKSNINEISIELKKKFLRNLVSSNSDLFDLSDELKEYFPILPDTQEKYCSLLPLIVRSIGIEEKVLKPFEIEKFNKDIISLSNSLASLSDEKFNKLEIKQEYDRDSFINDVSNTIKSLDDNEKQKVYDYFGFELHQNEHTKTKLTIAGYPKDNNKTDIDITDSKTKKAIEAIRPFVFKFNTNNYIYCSNKEIEEKLNEIIAILPELRVSIGKIQEGNKDENGIIANNGNHSFDAFKHSLKVMQKIVQDDNFNKLNDSDKKIMLIASLMHNISKKEGSKDIFHPKESSFDTFFIAKKFNLSQDEEVKLYNLIKYQKWLEFLDNVKSTKKIKDTAYDLRHDNMLDMSLIFTHANLKAVKDNDSFHNETGYGKMADIAAEKMQILIDRLKTTQPILPVTKIPSASRINEAIYEVHADGSTNIKGVYKNKDGLVILKYNELVNEELEKIGFACGSIVNGIKTATENGAKIDTGNIKFFAHGLEYPNQLAKFDIFSLVDSDALLSVSYAERPESKYRFFRPQGVLLDCDTKYIHGGGESDAGSGFNKSIKEFKDNYVFGGKKEYDRVYISDLIKNSTGMGNREYIKFVEDFKNKPFSEIKNKGLANRIISALASINSNSRLGDREYNEIFISNPKPPMAVFAYDMYEKKERLSPVEFLNEKSVKERTGFLQEYAINRDIPFVIFGN